MTTIHITINTAEDRNQPKSRNQASKCSFCGFTAVTNAKYKHEIEAHQDETLARALNNQEQHKSLSKTDLISLIGPDEQGKFLDYGLTLHTLQTLYEQLRTSVQQDVAQVQQDVAQVQQDVAQVKDNVEHIQDNVEHIQDNVEHIQDDVEHIQDDVEHIHEEVAHLRHSFADVLEAFAELQRGQQEQQEHIRRVEGEQEAIRERQERQDRVLALLMQAQDIMNQRPWEKERKNLYRKREEIIL